MISPGYETGERSSLGERADRRRWRMQGGERVAGVGERRSRSVGKESTGHPNRVDTQNRFLQMSVTKTKIESCLPHYTDSKPFRQLKQFELEIFV